LLGRDQLGRADFLLNFFTVQIRRSFEVERLLRIREPISLKHPLVGLADLNNRDRLSASLSESFMSRKGRPAPSPRLIGRLICPVL